MFQMFFTTSFMEIKLIFNKIYSNIQKISYRFSPDLANWPNRALEAVCPVLNQYTMV